jgi:hypothetical protein
MENIFDFSKKAFQLWNRIQKSIPYLLILWSKIVACSAKISIYSSLENNTAEVINIQLLTKIVKTCVSLKVQQVSENDEDFENNAEELILLLDNLGCIARCKYQDCAPFVLEIFVSLKNRYYYLITRCSTQSELSKDHLKHLECQLAFVIYVMSSFVGSRVSYVSADEHDLQDADFTVELINFISLSQNFINNVMFLYLLL